MLKAIKEKIRQRFVAEYANTFARGDIDPVKLKGAVSRVMEELIRQERTVLSSSEKSRVIDEMIDEFLGFGPIDEFLKDPSITEIMINGPDKIYVERNGQKTLTPNKFDDEHQLMYLVYKILAPTRRHVDESYPYTDVSLPDGSRVNIIIPPLALEGPTVTIRKFLKELQTAEDLMRLGTIERRMSDFLIACIRAKANIIFSGASGAGKTTTLNVYSSYIPEDERIITIEDTAELRLNQEHVVRLEAKQASIEGKGEVSIRDLFKNSLRMRPQRIILGEIRGAEALDMLQAICSGHRGSLVVLHAESPQDVIYRLETMIIASGLPITLEAIHRQIAAGINLLVHQEQLLDGARKITHISQVKGLKDGQVELEDLFSYNIEGFDAEGNVRGHWQATGALPVFQKLLNKAGITLPPEMFRKG
jgi:pilus assembly protein CpaF